MAYGADKDGHAWATVANAAESDDNGAAAIQDPDDATGEGMSNGTHFMYQFHSAVTRVEMRLKYLSGITSVSTQCIVQPWGKDAAGTWIKLNNSIGNHEITMTAAPDDDFDDQTNKYTASVSVSIGRCVEMTAGIRTLFNGAGAADTSSIEVRSYH